MNPVGSSSDRSARRLAEVALHRLCAAAGSRASELVLIGGLVPELLVQSDDDHQGTIDVDILLDIGVVYDRDDLDFAWLERALEHAGFLQQAPNTGWRWVAEVERHAVTVEFLVDVLDSPDQEIALPGAERLGAKNLAGPGPALRHARTMMVAGSPLRVADLGGYLLAKAAAVLQRRAEKDYYDFAWVLVRSVREDPAAAATAVHAITSFAPDGGQSRLVLAACDRFLEPDAVGPVAYARGCISAGSQEPPGFHAEDAVIAVSRFRRELEARR